MLRTHPRRPRPAEVGHRIKTSCVFVLENTVCIITGGAFRRDMTRIVQSFSVPDGSVAHAKLKQWKEMDANISAIIQMLIEEEQTEAQVQAMMKKIMRLKELTKDGKRMNKQQWDEIFWAW